MQKPWNDKKNSRIYLLMPLLCAPLAGLSYASDDIPTVYGKVNLTLNQYKFDYLDTSATVKPYTEYTALDNWKLESNSSRLGIKGDYDISSALKAIYKLEFEIYPDGNSKGSTVFSQRSTYAGLQGKWGTLFAGKNDTPLKVIAAETIQVFKDLPVADFKYIMVGENRPNNIVQYTTPNMNGFIFSVQVAPGEQSGSEGAAGTTSTSNTSHGLIDTISSALAYNAGDIYFAAAADRNELNNNTLRLVSRIGLGPVKLAGLWQNTQRTYSSIAGSPAYIGLSAQSALPGDSSANTTTLTNPIQQFNADYKSQNAFALTATWAIDAWTLKGQYAQSISKNGTAADLSDTKAKSYALGFDYALSKNTKAFAYYAAIDTDGDNSIYDGKLKDKTIAVGWEFKF